MKDPFVKFSSVILSTGLIALSILGIPAYGQSQNLQKEANQYWSERNWEEAANAYKLLAEEKPDNGLYWFRMAAASFNTENFDQAAVGWEKAEELNFAVPNSRFNLARTFSRIGDIETALTWLKKSIEAGFSNLNVLRNNPDIASLREEQEFRSLLERAEKTRFPCRENPAYNKIDFWVGKWNVYVENGPQIGTNHIEEILSGCGYIENWTARNGSSGKSFFYLDTATNVWKQVWITEQAVNPGATKEKRMVAEYDNGGVRFQGEYFNANGDRVLDRTTLTPISADSVRQHIQTSTDGGDTWGQGFIGIYVRKPVQDN